MPVWRIKGTTARPRPGWSFWRSSKVSYKVVVERSMKILILTTLIWLAILIISWRGNEAQLYCITLFCSIDRGNTEKERKNPYPSDLDGEWIGIQKTSDFIDKKSRGNFGGFTVSRRIPTPDSRPQQTNHCRAYELRQPTINRPWHHDCNLPSAGRNRGRTKGTYLLLSNAIRIHVHLFQTNDRGITIISLYQNLIQWIDTYTLVLFNFFSPGSS